MTVLLLLLHLLIAAVRQIFFTVMASSLALILVLILLLWLVLDNFMGLKIGVIVLRFSRDTEHLKAGGFITPSTTISDLQSFRDAGFLLQMNATKVSGLTACTGLISAPAVDARKVEIAALRSELEALLELLK